MNPDHSKYYFRFALEVIALIYIAWWPSTWASGWLGFFYAAFSLTSVMLLWGIFNVPNDPSRSGKAPIKVNGYIRLAIEAFVFLFAAFCIYKIHGILFSALFLAATLAHYIHTKQRILWLLKN